MCSDFSARFHRHTRRAAAPRDLARSVRPAPLHRRPRQDQGPDVTDYTVDGLRSLVSVNIEGFFFISQLAIKQILAQKTGGSIVNITSTLVDHPIAGVNSAVPMVTKGGLRLSRGAWRWNT
jgi:NAD(P)-dependent dehydrogenase (short-subunit alcohol dehydrogenase family)